MEESLSKCKECQKIIPYWPGCGDLGHMSQHIRYHRRGNDACFPSQPQWPGPPGDGAGCHDLHCTSKPIRWHRRRDVKANCKYVDLERDTFRCVLPFWNKDYLMSLCPHKKPPDLSQTPWNAQKICEEATSKELNADLRRAINRGDEIPREYKLQTPGEEVELTGMQNHEALNGCSGEVLSRVADDQGFLMVRVQMTTGTKNMKIQPRCLKPIRHPKDGRTRGARLTAFAANPEALSVLSSTPPTSLSASAPSILSTHTVNDSSNLSKAPLEAIRETSRPE